MYKKDLRKVLFFESYDLNEVDWDNTFKDVKKSCINPNELVDYLNRVRANAGKSTQDREKFNLNKPYVHAKSRNFKLDQDTVDIDYFIKQITLTPNSLITNYNSKINKSGSPDEHVYSTGIPAFRGIVYDIENSKFYNVNTCPGAGDCVLICYAMKGNYIRYPKAYDLMTRRLNYLLNYPDKFQQQLYNEIKDKCEEHGALEDSFDTVVIRWNDSGDFFAKKYTHIADEVIKALQNDGYNVQSYGYTKVADVANNKNTNTRFSSGSNKRELGKNKSEYQSTVIPKEVFQGLNINSKKESEIIKKRVAQHFDISNVITYRELRSIPEGPQPKWNVILSNGDGDNAAWRKDVANVLLLQH